MPHSSVSSDGGTGDSPQHLSKKVSFIDQIPEMRPSVKEAENENTIYETEPTSKKFVRRPSFELILDPEVRAQREVANESGHGDNDTGMLNSQARRRRSSADPGEAAAASAAAAQRLAFGFGMEADPSISTEPIPTLPRTNISGRPSHARRSTLELQAMASELGQMDEHVHYVDELLANVEVLEREVERQEKELQAKDQSAEVARGQYEETIRQLQDRLAAAASSNTDQVTPLGSTAEIENSANRLRGVLLSYVDEGTSSKLEGPVMEALPYILSIARKVISQSEEQRGDMANDAARELIETRQKDATISRLEEELADKANLLQVKDEKIRQCEHRLQTLQGEYDEMSIELNQAKDVLVNALQEVDKTALSAADIQKDLPSLLQKYHKAMESHARSVDVKDQARERSVTPDLNHARAELEGLRARYDEKEKEVTELKGRIEQAGADKRELYRLRAETESLAVELRAVKNMKGIKDDDVKNGDEPPMPPGGAYESETDPASPSPCLPRLDGGSKSGNPPDTHGSNKQGRGEEPQRNNHAADKRAEELKLMIGRLEAEKESQNQTIRRLTDMIAKGPQTQPALKGSTVAHSQGPGAAGLVHELRVDNEKLRVLVQKLEKDLEDGAISHKAAISGMEMECQSLSDQISVYERQLDEGRRAVEKASMEKSATETRMRDDHERFKDKAIVVNDELLAAVRRLEATNEKLGGENAYLVQNEKILQSRLKDEQKRLREELESHALTQEKMEALGADLGTMERNVSSLKRELEQALDDASTERSNKEEALANIQVVYEKLKEREAQIHSLEVSLRAAESQVADLTSQVSIEHEQSRNIENRLKDELLTLREGLSSRESLVVQQELDFKKADKALSDAKLQVQLLEQDRDGLGAECETLRRSVARLTTDLTETKDSLNQRNDEIMLLEQERSSLGAKIENVSQKLRDATEALHARERVNMNLETEKNRLTNDVANLKQSIETESREHESECQRHADTKRDLERSHASFTELDGKHRTLCDQLAKTAAEKALLDGQFRKVKGELEDTKKSLREREGIVVDVQVENKKMKEEVSNLLATIESREAALEELNRQKADIEKRLKNDVDTLRHALNTTTERVTQISMEKQQALHEINQLSEQLGVASAERDTVSERLNLTGTALDRESTAAAELERSVRLLRAELMETKEQSSNRERQYKVEANTLREEVARLNDERAALEMDRKEKVDFLSKVSLDGARMDNDNQRLAKEVLRLQDALERERASKNALMDQKDRLEDEMHTLNRTCKDVLYEGMETTHEKSAHVRDLEEDLNRTRDKLRRTQRDMHKKEEENYQLINELSVLKKDRVDLVSDHARSREEAELERMRSDQIAREKQSLMDENVHLTSALVTEATENRVLRAVSPVVSPIRPVALSGKARATDLILEEASRRSLTAELDAATRLSAGAKASSVTKWDSFLRDENDMLDRVLRKVERNIRTPVATPTMTGRTGSTSVSEALNRSGHSGYHTPPLYDK